MTSLWHFHTHISCDKLAFSQQEHGRGQCGVFYHSLCFWLHWLTGNPQNLPAQPPCVQWHLTTLLLFKAIVIYTLFLLEISAHKASLGFWFSPLFLFHSLVFAVVLGTELGLTSVQNQLYHCTTPFHLLPLLLSWELQVFNNMPSGFCLKILKMCWQDGLGKCDVTAVKADSLRSTPGHTWNERADSCKLSWCPHAFSGGPTIPNNGHLKSHQQNERGFGAPL